jgi:hypothetical protein
MLTLRSTIPKSIRTRPLVPSSLLWIVGMGLAFMIYRGGLGLAEKSKGRLDRTHRP